MKMKTANILLKMLSSKDITNASSVSEIMPKKADKKAIANSGKRQASKPTMGEDASLQPTPAEANSGDRHATKPAIGDVEGLEPKQAEAANY